MDSEPNREIQIAQNRLSMAIQESQLADLRITIEKLLLEIEIRRHRYSKTINEDEKTLISLEISEKYCEIEVLRCKERKAKHLRDKFTGLYDELINYVSPCSSVSSVTSNPDAS